MKYENMIKVMADGDKSQFERGDILIKEMNRLSSDILDYRYAAEHYKGNGTVLEDKKNHIKNSLVLVITDLDVYMEQMEITETVHDKANKRLNKLVEKIS